MAARGKATVETYQLGLRLLAMRKQAKHGEWLECLRQARLSQPTAWRYMRFATRVQTEPQWKWLREQDRLVRRIAAGERAYERRNGHRRDWTKLPTGLAEMTSTPSRGARKPRTARGAKQTTAPEEGGAR